MRKKIGIITGSGPEAGIDLWEKILKENKEILKDKFTGDLDAPDITIFSIPSLGHSMELEKNYDMVWNTLEKAVKEMYEKVDYFVIACNTLNVYENKIEEIGLKDKFLSTLDVVKNYIEENNLTNISIIGALPVLQMKKFSVFQSLNNTFDIEVPNDFEKVHKLIYEVKKYGGSNEKVINDFRFILNDIKTNNIFLACTELPLIQLELKEKNLIDVTELLAKELVKKTL
jgi:aspartate racemase